MDPPTSHPAGVCDNKEPSRPLTSRSPARPDSAASSPASCTSRHGPPSTKRRPATSTHARGARPPRGRGQPALSGGLTDEFRPRSGDRPNTVLDGRARPDRRVGDAVAARGAAAAAADALDARSAHLPSGGAQVAGPISEAAGDPTMTAPPSPPACLVGAGSAWLGPAAAVIPTRNLSNGQSVQGLPVRHGTATRQPARLRRQIRYSRSRQSRGPGSRKGGTLRLSDDAKPPGWLRASTPPVTATARIAQSS